MFPWQITFLVIFFLSLCLKLDCYSFYSSTFSSSFFLIISSSASSSSGSSSCYHFSWHRLYVHSHHILSSSLTFSFFFFFHSPLLFDLICLSENFIYQWVKGGWGREYDKNWIKIKSIIIHNRRFLSYSSSHLSIVSILRIL